MREQINDTSAVRQLCRTLKELMQRKPLEKITIKEITTQAHTHRLTFYYHFKDKYELLQYIFYSDLEQIRKTTNATDTLGIVIELFRYLVENEALYNNAFISDDYQSLRVSYTDITKLFFEELIEQLADESTLEIDKKNIIDFYSHAVTVHIINWLKEPQKIPYEEAAKQLVMMIEHGFIKLIGQ